MLSLKFGDKSSNPIILINQLWANLVEKLDLMKYFLIIKNLLSVLCIEGFLLKFCLKTVTLKTFSQQMFRHTHTKEHYLMLHIMIQKGSFHNYYNYNFSKFKNVDFPSQVFNIFWVIKKIICEHVWSFTVLTLDSFVVRFSE